MDDYKYALIAVTVVVVILLVVILVLSVLLCRWILLVKKLKREIISAQDGRAQDVDVAATASDAHGGNLAAISTKEGGRLQNQIVPDVTNVDSSGYESISGKMLAAMRGREEGGKSKADGVLPHWEKLHTIADIENEDSNGHALSLPESVPASLGYATVRDLDSPMIAVGDDDSMYATIRTRGACRYTAHDSSGTSPLRCSDGAENFASQPHVSAPHIYSIVYKRRKAERGRETKEGGAKGSDCYQHVLEGGVEPFQQVTHAAMKEEDSKNTPTFAEGEIKDGGEGNQGELACQQAQLPSDCTTNTGEDRSVSAPNPVKEGFQMSEGTVEEILSPPPPLPPYTLEMNQLSKAAGDTKGSQDTATRSYDGGISCDSGDPSMDVVMET